MRTQVVAVTVVGICAIALADSHVRFVRVSFISRGVQVQRPGFQTWEAALNEAPVIEAERFRTTAGGRAEVQLECGSALRLAPNSGLIFSKLALTDAGQRVTTAVLTQGSGEATMRKPEEHGFELDFPGGAVTATVGDTSLRVDLSPAGAPPRIAVLAGKAQVTAGGTQFDLKKDEVLTLNRAGGGDIEYFPGGDAFSAWVRHRDSAYEAALAVARLHTPAAESVTSPGSGATAGAPALVLKPTTPPPPPSYTDALGNTITPPPGNSMHTTYTSSLAGDADPSTPDAAGRGDAGAGGGGGGGHGGGGGGGGGGGRGGRSGGSGLPKAGTEDRVPSCSG